MSKSEIATISSISNGVNGAPVSPNSVSNTATPTATTTTTSSSIIIPTNLSIKQAAGLNSASSQTSWLLRFFESKHFDMSMAISYLFKTKEPGVQTYLCNRLFTFNNSEVDFYLPQLLNIYIYCCNDSNEQLIADLLNAYFRMRCSCRTTGIDFSLRCSWLLDAHINDNAKLAVNTKETRIRRGLNNAIKLYKLIRSERLRPPVVNTNNHKLNENNLASPVKEESANEMLDESSSTNSIKHQSKQHNINSSRTSLNHNFNYNLHHHHHHHNHNHNHSHHHFNHSHQHSFNGANGHSKSKPTHNRTRSDTTGITNSLNNNHRSQSITSLKVTIGDLMSGRAFDNNCNCIDNLIVLHQNQSYQQPSLVKKTESQAELNLHDQLLVLQDKHTDNNSIDDNKENLVDVSTPDSQSPKLNGNDDHNDEDLNTNINNCNIDIDKITASTPAPIVNVPLAIPQLDSFECVCNAPRLAPEFEFTKALISIGKKLVRLASKELKSDFFSSS